MSVALLLTVLLAADDQETKNDLAKFQGSWRFVSVIADGTPALQEQIKGSVLTNEGTTFTFKDPGSKDPSSSGAGTFRIDATKDPRQMDITFGTGPDKGQTVYGIYRFEGNKARVCLALPGKPRPTQFESPSGGGLVLEVLEPIKK
jgi:uncharacterized protein (TIGR03067 family)